MRPGKYSSCYSISYRVVCVLLVCSLLVQEALAQQNQQNQNNGRRQQQQQRRQKQQRQQQQQQQPRQEYGQSSGPRYNQFGMKKTGYRYTDPPTIPTTTTTTTTTTTARPPRPRPGEEYLSYEENDSQFIVPDKPPPPVSPIVGFVTTTASPIVLNSGGNGNGWDVRDTIPGRPGQDYPVYSRVPKTSFTCEGRKPGFYADPETGCQAFHRCTDCSERPTLEQSSMLCPNGTLFSQQVLTCDWWANVECPGSENYYFLNQEIGAVDQDGKYLLLSAYRRPPTEKKVAPRIIPQEEREPLPPQFQTNHGQSDYNQHHNSNQHSQQQQQPIQNQQQQQRNPLPPIAGPQQNQNQNRLPPIAGPQPNQNQNQNRGQSQGQQRPQQQFQQQQPQSQQRPKLQNNFKANQQANSQQQPKQQQPVQKSPPPPQPQAFNSAKEVADNFDDYYFNEDEDNVVPAKTNIQTILSKIENEDDIPAQEQRGRKGAIVGFQAQNTNNNDNDNEPIPFRSGSLKSKGPSRSTTTSTTTTQSVSSTTPRGSYTEDEDELFLDESEEGEEIKENEPASFIVNRRPPENILEDEDKNSRGSKGSSQDENQEQRQEQEQKNGNRKSKKGSKKLKPSATTISQSTTPKGLDPPTINFEDVNGKSSSQINNRSNNNKNPGISRPDDEYLPPTPSTTTTTTTTSAPAQHYLPIESYGEPPGGYDSNSNSGGYSNSNSNSGGYSNSNSNNNNHGGYSNTHSNSGYESSHSQSNNNNHNENPTDEYLPPKDDKPNDEYLPPKQSTPELPRYVTPPPEIKRPRDSYEPVADKHYRKPSNGYHSPITTNNNNQNQNSQYGAPAPLPPVQLPPVQNTQYTAPQQQYQNIQYSNPPEQQQNTHYAAPQQNTQYGTPQQQNIQQQQQFQVQVPVFAAHNQVAAPIVYQASHLVTPSPFAQLLQQNIWQK